MRKRDTSAIWRVERYDGRTGEMIVWYLLGADSAAIVCCASSVAPHYDELSMICPTHTKSCS